MIIGECPYCDELIINACAEKTPCFSKEICRSCRKEYWLRHSRVDPEAYPVEHVRVNTETQSIEILEEGK